MTIAEHAERLERASGLTLDHFPYDQAARAPELHGLEKLRAVGDPGLRRTCWALYWVMEAKGGGHPAQPPPRAELEEWDGTWTRGEDLIEQDRKAASLGLTRDGISGLLSACWERFERDMGEWSIGMYREAGVSVSDAQKAQHRRGFHRLLKKEYGRSEAPARNPDR